MSNINKERQIRGKGVIIKTIDDFAHWLYIKIIFGFFGRLFSSYSSGERVFARSAVSKVANGGLVRNKAGFGKIKRKVARSFENSTTVRIYKKLLEKLMSCKLKIYGTFFAISGLLIFFEYFVHKYSITGISPHSSYYIIGGVFLIASLPLLMSKMTLADALRRSRMCKGIAVGFFGIDDDRINRYTSSGGDSYPIAVIAAFAFAAASFFVNPLTCVIAVAVLAIICLIMTIPEAGVNITVFCLPFLGLTAHPTRNLTVMVLITSLSFLVKLICSRRVFKFRLMDFMVVLFGSLIFFGGVFTYGGDTSFQTAISYCVLLFGYFLVANLMRTKTWLKRCINAFLTSSVFVSAYGVVQYFFVKVDPSWIDVNIFPNIDGRVTSTFGNPNVLAVYLVLALPLSVALLMNSKKTSKIVWYSLQVVLNLCCCVLTWSRGGWLGVIAAMIMFFFMYSHHTVTVTVLAALPIGLAVPYLGEILPQNFVSRFASISSAIDTSSRFRFGLWNGTIEMIKDNFFGGIGIGTDAFSNVYAAYAVSGTESAIHSHSLYLQIFLSIGIVGIVMFLGIIFLLFKNGFERMLRSKDRFAGSVILAGLSAIFGTLVMGAVDYIWYNMSIFFMFWFVFALVCAYASADREEEEREFVPISSDETQSDIFFEYDSHTFKMKVNKNGREDN